MSRLLPVSGVVPPSVAEATVMTVWPSVACTTIGQVLGRLYRIREGFGPLSFGRMALLATIPVGLGLYLSMRLPWAIRRYRLTNRRVMIERGVNPKVEQYVDLDRFDAIDVVVSHRFESESSLLSFPGGKKRKKKSPPAKQNGVRSRFYIPLEMRIGHDKSGKREKKGVVNAFALSLSPLPFPLSIQHT